MAEKIIRIVNIAFRTRKFVCILKCQSFQTLHSTSSWGCRNYNHDHIVAKFWSLLNCLIIHSEHLANESVHAKVSFCFSIAYMGFPSCKRGWDKAVHIEEMLETKHPMCIRFYVSLIYPKIQCFKKIVCCVWVKINNKCHHGKAFQVQLWCHLCSGRIHWQNKYLTKQKEFQSMLGLAWIIVPGSTAKKVN
jgi:hypothetical protein